MEQINKYRSPIVLGVLILFLLLFAFYMLGIQPDHKKVEAQKNEISQLSKENGLLQTKIDELKNSDVEDEAQEALLTALPRGDGSEQLIVDLHSIEAKSYAKIKEITFARGEGNPIQEMTASPDIQFPTVKQLKMTAVVEGGYTEIYNWITMLQLLPRIVNVDSFSFQQPEGQSAQDPANILTANVTFTAFFEDVPAEQN